MPRSGRVVEYTGGSTGTSLAFACGARGYPITVVTSDAFSQEKRDHMRALGAEVIELDSDAGRITKELIERMIETAGFLPRQRNSWYGIVDERPLPAGVGRGPQDREEGATHRAWRERGASAAGTGEDEA